MFTNATNLGPYLGVIEDKTRGRYRLAIYQAYNAMGLIGTEYNGIVVLDNELMQVVADNIGVGTGARAQMELLRNLLQASPEVFAKTINDSSRSRYDIDPATVPEAEPLFKEI